MENNEFANKIGNKIQSKLLNYEILILIIVIAALCFRIFKVPNTGTIVTLVLMSISCLYFFSAFGTSAKVDITAFDNFIMKLLGLASSISIVGILFLIQGWPSSQTMVTVGLMSLVTCLFYIVYQKMTISETEIYNKLVLVRIITLALISLGLLYFWTK